MLRAQQAFATQRAAAVVLINASRGPSFDVPIGAKDDAIEERGTAVQSQTLPNGVRVVALPSGGAVGSVGVFLKGGLRAPAKAGVAAVLGQAIYSTTSTRSNLLQTRELEQTGAQITTGAHRETFSFSANVVKSSAPALLRLLADGICAARLSEYDVETLLETLTAGAPRSCLKDLAHSVAFRFAGLGAPRGIPVGAHVHGEDVLALRDAVVVPSNVVVSGVGFALPELVKAASDAFGGLHSKASAPAFATAPYVGGEHVAYSLTRAPGGVVAFEAAGGFASDVVFSVGLGIAKLTATAGAPFYAPYSDSGLIGTSFKGNKAIEAVAPLAALRAGKFSDEQLAAGKRRAKAAYLFALESNASLASDIGKQALWTGKWRSVAETVAAIEGVTAAQVKAAFDAAIKKPITFVVSTDGSAMPDAAAVAKAARA